MKLSLKSQVPAALLLCFGFSAAQGVAQTADEVIEKHVAAIGGRAALQKLETRIATGTVSLSAQGTPLSGPMEVYAKAPNKSRTYFTMDLSQFGAGEIVVDQRCDGKTAWASNSMTGEKELTGSQLQSMLNATFPSQFLNYKESGAKVEMLAKDTVNGRAALVMQYTPKAGAAAKQYFDAETFLILRSVMKMEVPEAGGEVEQRTEFEDYRTVDGIKVPFVLKIANGMQDLTITLNKVEHNKPIDEAMFSKPVK